LAEHQARQQSRLRINRERREEGQQKRRAAIDSMEPRLKSETRIADALETFRRDHPELYDWYLENQSTAHKLKRCQDIIRDIVKSDGHGPFNPDPEAA
jgi:hypothetical protein